MSVNMIQSGSFFHLYNDAVSYIVRRLENDMFEHIYFGDRLFDLSEEDYLYLAPLKNKPSGAVKYDRNLDLYLSSRAIEYPVFGTGDFKTGAFALERNGVPVYPELEFLGAELSEGVMARSGFPGVREEEGAKTAVFQFQDRLHQFRMNLRYTLFDKDPVIVKSCEIINESEDGLQITALASGVLHVPDGNWQANYLSGNWAREFQLKTASVDHADLIIDSKYGSSSHKHNPYVALTDGNRCYTSNLIYSGNFCNRIQSDEFGNLRMISGLNPETFETVLACEETFVSPQVYQAYSGKGLPEAAAVNQVFVRDHIVSPYWKARKRPVVLNSWEALYFTLNEENVYALAKEAKAVGADCLVVDDGWFARRDADRSSLGDWYTDERKFPQGLGSLAARIHDLGLEFGLWFEPEMVNEDAQFYAQHPDFVVRPAQGRYSLGRSQLVLDFCNPECVKAVYAQMKKIIEETELDYIKWDMNRDITEAYSPYLQENNISQKEFYHRYICGVYRLYEMILEDFPHVLIEGCASGGGRFDAGILYYSPQIWTSDDTDAFERLAIQRGASLAYPLSALSNHISAIPNHQTYRKTSLKMREQVAAFGILGLELNLLECTKEEKAELSACIARYKALQPMLLEASLYPLEFNDTWHVFCAVSKDRNFYLTGFFSGILSLKASRDERIFLPHINESAVYAVDETPIAGSVLKQAGLRKPVRFNGANLAFADFKGDFQSKLTRIRKKATNDETA